MDIDKDGALDMVFLHGALSEELPAALTFLFDRGDGTIREVRLLAGFPYSIEVAEGTRRAGVNFADLATGDFNGDRTIDIALINWRGGIGGYIAEAVLWILDGTGGGNFAQPRIYPAPSDARRIVTLGNVDRQFVRGDASDDRKVNITDAVVIGLALYQGIGVNCGQALDANDDARLNVADAIFVLQHLFLGGPPPPPPYPEPGIDATDPFLDDGLGTSYPGCSPEWWKVFRERTR